MKNYMKLTYSILGFTAGAALLLASGCSKQEPPSGETPKAMPPTASDTLKAPEPAKAAVEQAQPAVAAAAEQAVKAVVSETNAAAAPASQIEGLIYNAKGLVANQQYQDALNVVQQLSGMKLTAEQQKLVDGLKTQVQAALAKAAGADAASALGNPLGGKK